MDFTLLERLKKKKKSPISEKRCNSKKIILVLHFKSIISALIFKPQKVSCIVFTIFEQNTTTSMYMVQTFCCHSLHCRRMSLSRTPHLLELKSFSLGYTFSVTLVSTVLNPRNLQLFCVSHKSLGQGGSTVTV